MSTVFEGNLGNTPELRFTGQGALTQAVTTLRVCSNRRRRIEDGTYETLDELWMNVEVWGRQAESCAKGLRKGAPLVIVGDLRDNSYEKDGKRVNSVKLVAQHVGLNLSRVDALQYETRKAANDPNGNARPDRAESPGQGRTDRHSPAAPDGRGSIASYPSQADEAGQTGGFDLDDGQDPDGQPF